MLCVQCKTNCYDSFPPSLLFFLWKGFSWSFADLCADFVTLILVFLNCLAKSGLMTLWAVPQKGWTFILPDTHFNSLFTRHDSGQQFYFYRTNLGHDFMMRKKCGFWDCTGLEPPFRTVNARLCPVMLSLVCSQAEMPFRRKPFVWNLFFFFCPYVKVRRSVVFVCLCGMNTCQGSTPTAGETCQINLRHHLFHCSTFFVKFFFLSSVIPATSKQPCV